MENETYRFIALIEKHPQLYNKKHKDFLRQDIRNTIWESICKEMNWDDANKAKKRWRNLRDKFVKKRRRGPGAAEDESQREFYNSLRFLDEHVNSRSVRTSASSNSASTITTNSNTSTTTAVNTSNPVITNTTQYVQVTPGQQIPIEQINLEYLSGVNVSEDAQCLLDISNNTTNVISNHHSHQSQHQQSQQSQQHQTQQQTHQQQPQQHQSLAAQHIQQFKIEYPADENEYDGEPAQVIVQQCAVVEAVPATEENAINNYEQHNITTTQATLPHQTQHIRTLTNNTTKKVYHQIINSNGMITSHPAATKRQRLDVSSNEDITEAITAAVDYFKHQTSVGDADAAFAKYILEELRQMNKRRKNEFKRMVTTWLTTQDDEIITGD